MESQQLVYPIKWPQLYKNAFQPNNHFNKTVHDIIWLFWSETRVSVISCKVRRAFSLEISFNQNS